MDKKETKSVWDKEKQAEYYKEWRKKNKERLAEYQKKWREENKDHVNQYLEDNKEKIAEKSKNWRETHGEERKKLWSKWYENNRKKSPKRRFSSAISKSKTRHINWNLTFEEYNILISKPCYYCDNKLGKPVETSIGLDRLDSNGGYDLSNVVSCCFTCNVLKNAELSPEETKVAVKAILDFRNQQLLLNVYNKKD